MGTKMDETKVVTMRRKNPRTRTLKQKKKKSKEDVEDENDDKFEDSDDGDNEGRECEYISDESSEDEEENPEYEQKGVDQAKALSKLLDSEESSSEDENKKSDEEGDDEDETGKKKKKKKGEEAGEEENASKDMPDGAEDEKAKKAEKRKALVDNVLDINAAGPSAKKGRMDPFPQGAGTSRKAMTITELLRKMKSKSATDDKDELMPRLVSALKSINPHKQRVKGTMYLSLR